VVSDLLGVLDSAAVFQVGGDAGGPECPEFKGHHTELLGRIPGDQEELGEKTLRQMAIRQARLEPLAFSAFGHERMVNGWAAASGEKRIDFVCTNRLFR
jgi:hypothetical protein